MYTKLFAASLLLPYGRISWMPESLLEKLDQYRILLPANSKDGYLILLSSPLLGGGASRRIQIYICVFLNIAAHARC